MDPSLLPVEVARVGPLSLTDTLVSSVGIAVFLVCSATVMMRIPRTRRALLTVYEGLEAAIVDTVEADARPMVPLILTLWVFLLVANLAGLVPFLSSPTRDLSITTALSLIAFVAGHVYAAYVQGVSYLRHYLEPHPLLLPFNIIGELSRTLALSLRLFGNMLSGHLILAILVYLVGFLLPVPLMLLSVLTGVVQAYIFGVLTLVFAVSSVTVARRGEADSPGPSSGKGYERGASG